MYTYAEMVFYADRNTVESTSLVPSASLCEVEHYSTKSFGLLYMYTNVRAEEESNHHQQQAATPPPPKVMAAMLYEKAVAQGDPGAMYNLALFYRDGQGVVQSFEKAAELYTMAAARWTRNCAIVQESC